MPDTKISALADGLTAVGTDRLPVARSPFGPTDNPYITPAYISTYLKGLANTWAAQQTFLQPLLAPDGSASAPAYSFSSDPDSGWYRAASNDVRFSLDNSDTLRVQSDRLVIKLGASLVWASSGVASHDLFLTRDAANTLAQRNGTNAQIFRVYGTESSSLTNYERLFFKAVAGAAFQIGIENNGTGVARDLSVVVGGFTSTFTTSGEFHSATHVRVPPTGIIYWHQRARMLSSADGIIALYNSAMANFSRLQFGGTTASFPAWKRSGADIHAVLADDTGFTKIKGKHQTDADAVAETITPTHTLTLYDAAGTAYKVACVAA